MAALRLPILPIPPRMGTPVLPILPAPPIGEGRNGKREQEAMTADLFGLERAPPRIRNCKTAAALRELLQTLT